MKYHARSSGFTLAEIVVCVVILTILMTLGGIGANTVRSRAKRASCVSNIRKVGDALHLYAADHNMTLPAIDYSSGEDLLWADYLEPYDKSLDQLVCPEADRNVVKHFKEYGHYYYKYPESLDLSKLGSEDVIFEDMSFFHKMASGTYSKSELFADNHAGFREIKIF